MTNLEEHAQPIKHFKGAKLLDLVKDEDFAESNLMHNIHGYMYGNNMDVLCKNHKVRWYVVLPCANRATLHIGWFDGSFVRAVRRYLLAFGTEVDLHTAHWHGLTVLSDGHRMDVIELLPATFRTVELVCESPWKPLCLRCVVPAAMSFIHVFVVGA